MKDALIRSLIAIMSLFLSSNIYATEDGYTCAGRKQVLENKLGYAQKIDNQYEVMRLTTALKGINSHCSNVSLEKKYLDNVSKKIKKVAKYQKDIAEAKINRNEKKIIEKQKKLEDAQVELNAAKVELDNFYKVLQHERAK
ncbi:MAG: DUF1090 family protein [Candidatus Schmidhempelia sp.]|nr:DUF1090 family protein [Candidatus Schmidhempelia sp.]